MMFDQTYYGQPGVTQSLFTPHGVPSNLLGPIGQPVGQTIGGWPSYPQLAGHFGQGFGSLPGYPQLGGQIGGPLGQFGQVAYALPALAQLCGQLGQFGQGAYGWPGLAQLGGQLGQFGQAAHGWPGLAQLGGQLGVSPWQIAQQSAFGNPLGQLGPVVVAVPTLVPPGVFGHFPGQIMPGQIGQPLAQPIGWPGLAQLGGQFGAVGPSIFTTPTFVPQGILGVPQAAFGVPQGLFGASIGSGVGAGAFGQRGFGTGLSGPVPFQTTPQLAYAG